MILASVDFGFMYDQETMMSMYTVQPTKTSDITFHMKMLHREIVVQMTLELRDPRPFSPHRKYGQNNRDDIIRFSIPFSQLEVVHEIQNRQDRVVFLVSLDTPPRFFRRIDEIETHEQAGRYWTERDAWYRQTDIVYDRNVLKDSSITLKKTKPIIDLGKWYRTKRYLT